LLIPPGTPEGQGWEMKGSPMPDLPDVWRPPTRGSRNAVGSLDLTPRTAEPQSSPGRGAGMDDVWRRRLGSQGERLIFAADKPGTPPVERRGGSPDIPRERAVESVAETSRAEETLESPLRRYHRELDEQVRLKNERKHREQQEQRRFEEKVEREAQSDPWGRPGAGAPLRKPDGSVVTNVKDYLCEAFSPGGSPQQRNYETALGGEDLQARPRIERKLPEPRRREDCRGERDEPFGRPGPPSKAQHSKENMQATPQPGDQDCYGEGSRTDAKLAMALDAGDHQAIIRLFSRLELQNKELREHSREMRQDNLELRTQVKALTAALQNGLYVGDRTHQMERGRGPT